MIHLHWDAMAVKPKWLLIGLVLLVATTISTASARDYYRWVDENGVVHFSEHPPPDDVSQLERIRLQDPQSDPGAGDDPFNIEATAERTQAQREELQKRRETARENRMELERIAARQQVVHHHYAGGYVPNWYTRPPLVPRPPIARPPSRPEVEPYPTVPFRPPGAVSR